MVLVMVLAMEYIGKQSYSSLLRESCGRSWPTLESSLYILTSLYTFQGYQATTLILSLPAQYTFLHFTDVYIAGDGDNITVYIVNAMKITLSLLELMYMYWMLICVIVSVSIYFPFSITVATGCLRGQLQSRQKNVYSTSLHCSSCYGCGAQLSSSTPLESPATKKKIQVAFPLGYTLGLWSWVYCRWVCIATYYDKSYRKWYGYAKSEHIGLRSEKKVATFKGLLIVFSHILRR